MNDMKQHNVVSILYINSQNGELAEWSRVLLTSDLCNMGGFVARRGIMKFFSIF